MGRRAADGPIAGIVTRPDSAVAWAASFVSAPAADVVYVVPALQGVASPW